MAFLFGKRKQNREGTPTSQANPPTSSGNSSLATLDNVTSSPEQKRDLHQPDRTAPPIQQYGSQPPPLQGPPTLLQNRPSTSSSNASLYPWSHRRLTLTNGISPFPRLDHAANGIAGKEGEIYLLGGQTAQSAFGDLWMIEAGSQALNCYQLATQGDGPGMRSGHAGLLVGNAFILFGGDTRRSERDQLDDTLYLLNTTTKTWARSSPALHRPRGRYGHTLNIIGSKLYVFGGQVDGNPLVDLVSFDLNTLQKAGSRWETITPAPPPGKDVVTSADVPNARTNHSMITYDDKLYLFGGTNFSTWFNDVWTYDPQLNKWTMLDCIGYIPTPREGHAAALVGDVMYVLGGRTQDGMDQGDLAAFRITTQRWYTFQNMGPAPSPRSGLAMTTFGNKIFVYGGEPSLGAPRNTEELQQMFVLDTGKIRYPNDSQSQMSPPNERSRSILGRPGGANGSFGGSVGSIPAPGGRGRGTTPRESLVQSPGGGAGASRLPRASVVQQSSAGPPPQQQAPPPRTNGIPAPLNPRTMTPTQNRTLQEKPSINSIQEQSANQSGLQQPQSGIRRPSFSSQSGAPQVKDIIREAVQNANIPANGSAPVIQERSQSRQRSENRPNGDVSPDQTRYAAVDIAKQKAIEKELEELKRQNAWLTAEISLARRAGYSSMSTNSSDERRVSEPLQDSDRPLMEGLLSLKLELGRVHKDFEAQAADSAKKLAELERQKDVAISEAVYAKARLAAAGGSGASDNNVSSADAERLQETSKKLAASIAVQTELKKRLETLEGEVENERRSRQLAEETSQHAQARVDELDNFRNRAASEIEELRLELLDAEKAYRDLSSESQEALAEAKKLKIDKQELQNRLDAITESTQSQLSQLTSLQGLVRASTNKAEVLEKQLNDERSTREDLERNVSELKMAFENKSVDLEQAQRKLKDMEDLVRKYSDEAKASQAAVMDGLDRIGDRNLANSSSADDERLALLEEQLDSARELLKKSKAQADENGERLAQAMQRIAGLEFQQAQSSKDSIALRRRMGETHEELRRLRTENDNFSKALKEKKIALEESAAKYNALKEVLSERSAIGNFDKRRSVVIPSPVSAPMSGTATPEQLNRLREVELRLEESLRAHRETKFTAERSAQEIEKHFNEKLEQLETDYRAAVRYVKQTEKMLKLMKEELSRYKERVAVLEVERNEAREQLSRVNGSPDSNPEAAAEKVVLQNKLEDLNKRFIEQTTSLEKQLRDIRDELASVRLERDQLNFNLQRTESRLKEANASAAEARAHAERLEHENQMLDERANEAEQKVTQMLDQFESSVDAYRRTEFQTNANDLESARESMYGPDARSSIALDSLQTELDALRSHWETTKNNRLSTAFDFDNQKTPTGTEGGELSTSLARWRQRLELEEAEAAQARGQPLSGQEKREATAAV